MTKKFIAVKDYPHDKLFDTKSYYEIEKEYPEVTKNYLKENGEKIIKNYLNSNVRYRPNGEPTYTSDKVEKDFEKIKKGIKLKSEFDNDYLWGKRTIISIVNIGKIETMYKNFFSKNHYLKLEFMEKLTSEFSIYNFEMSKSLKRYFYQIVFVVGHDKDGCDISYKFVYTCEKQRDQVYDLILKDLQG